MTAAIRNPYIPRPGAISGAERAASGVLAQGFPPAGAPVRPGLPEVGPEQMHAGRADPEVEMAGSAFDVQQAAHHGSRYLGGDPGCAPFGTGERCAREEDSSP